MMRKMVVGRVRERTHQWMVKGVSGYSVQQLSRFLSWENQKTLKIF